jgi:hypothetical protein
MNASCPTGSRDRLLPAPLARWLALLVLAVLAGCASPPTMRGEVVRFHQWQGEPPLTFAFRPTPEQAGSLEHRSYQQLVRERMLAAGFAEASADAARYRVVLDVRATPEPRQTTEYWPPLGWGTGPWMGAGPWIGPRPFGPAWRYDPFWGMPSTPIVRDTTIWRHELRVDLFDVRAEPPPGRKVHETRAVAFATSESMPRLMPGLVAAAFAEFPGETGSTRRVEVPLPDLPR